MIIISQLRGVVLPDVKVTKCGIVKVVELLLNVFICMFIKDSHSIVLTGNSPT